MGYDWQWKEKASGDDHYDWFEIRMCRYSVLILPIIIIIGSPIVCKAEDLLCFACLINLDKHKTSLSIWYMSTL